MTDRVERLRAIAKEISDEGHTGWPNELNWIADALASERAKQAELLKERRGTEESLMALADAHADFHWHAGEEGRDGVYCPDSRAAREALRLAIREVLAERDEARHILSMQPHVAQAGAAAEERAERAEAEVERLRTLGDEQELKVKIWMESSDSYKDEAERLRNDLSVHKRLLDGKIADCISWINENERLRKDAERYRWLLENAVIETNKWRHDGHDPASTKQPLDAAIDAAIAQEAKP